MNKKKIVTVALAVCLIAILSMSTLAWFNASDSVDNDFMFDDSDNDGTPDFEVDLFETDANGGAVDGKEYLHVSPNAVLAKDPTVKNTGAYPMYIRVVVTLSDAAAWISASEKYDLTGANDSLTILEEMVDIHADWVRCDLPVRDLNADTITYVYYYGHKVAPGAVTAPVFEQVTIPYQLQQEDMTFGDAMFTIGVKADAIQADNIIPEGATITVNEAYTAFTTINWAAGIAYPEN